MFMNSGPANNMCDLYMLWQEVTWLEKYVTQQAVIIVYKPSSEHNPDGKIWYVWMEIGSGAYFML